MRLAMAAGMLIISGLAAASESQRADGLWLDIPYVEQKQENGCGAAAVAMVLAYWKAKGAVVEDGLDREVIFKRLYSANARGILASKMEQYFRDSGFDVFPVRGAWDDFRQQIAKGRPLIAGVRPSSKSALLHYVVIAGIDGDSAVLVNDPARGKLLRINRLEFEKEWSPVNHWLLVLVPRSR
jgi:ABC-type bacteriocin/lantibiotic exporter with double-glycine peptidase domain